MIASRKQIHSLPRKRHFNTPAAVAIVVFVDRAIDEYSGSFSGKTPVERGQTFAARMSGEADAVEWLEPRAF